ncbi:MAG: hypothetical protein AMJ78_08295 [Omnitrophica WOR_2 bacterium SM23_29]|nr:MAG: hypothetical protein AMJ78_08295 [Omnitrophica WOR_2 bacterium SM23_29]
MLKLKNLSRNKGYLLLEAIVSIAIIAIGLAIILRSFTSSLRASKISQEYLIASYILKDKIWELEEKANRESGLIESEATEQIPNTNYTLESKIKRITESDPLNEVKATISWQSGNRNEKIEVVTYLKYKEVGP